MRKSSSNPFKINIFETDETQVQLWQIAKCKYACKIPYDKQKMPDIFSLISLEIKLKEQHELKEIQKIKQLQIDIQHHLNQLEKYPNLIDKQKNEKLISSLDKIVIKRVKENIYIGSESFFNDVKQQYFKKLISQLKHNQSQLNQYIKPLQNDKIALKKAVNGFYQNNIQNEYNLEDQTLQQNITHKRNFNESDEDNIEKTPISNPQKNTPLNHSTNQPPTLYGLETLDNAFDHLRKQIKKDLNRDLPETYKDLNFQGENHTIINPKTGSEEGIIYRTSNPQGLIFHNLKNDKHFNYILEKDIIRCQTPNPAPTPAQENPFKNVKDEIKEPNLFKQEAALEVDEHNEEAEQTEKDDFHKKYEHITVEDILRSPEPENKEDDDEKRKVERAKKQIAKYIKPRRYTTILEVDPNKVEVKYLIEPFIPKNSLSGTSGPKGSMKSAGCFQEIIKSLSPNEKLLYISQYENTIEKMAAFEDESRFVMPDRIVYEDIEDFLIHIQVLRNKYPEIAAILIDPLPLSLFPIAGDEVEYNLGVLLRYGEETGLTIHFVRNQAKGEKYDDEADKMAGMFLYRTVPRATNVTIKVEEKSLAWQMAKKFIEKNASFEEQVMDEKETVKLVSLWLNIDCNYKTSEKGASKLFIETDKTIYTYNCPKIIKNYREFIKPKKVEDLKDQLLYYIVNYSNLTCTELREKASQDKFINLKPDTIRKKIKEYPEVEIKREKQGKNHKAHYRIKGDKKDIIKKYS